MYVCRHLDRLWVFEGGFLLRDLLLCINCGAELVVLIVAPHYQVSVLNLNLNIFGGKVDQGGRNT